MLAPTDVILDRHRSHLLTRLLRRKQSSFRRKQYILDTKEDYSNRPMENGDY